MWFHLVCIDGNQAEVQSKGPVETSSTNWNDHHNKVCT